MGVGHVEDAPHTAAAEELLVRIHNAVGHGNVRQAEVRKFGLVLVGLVVEDDVDLVNDLVAASGSNFVFDHLGIGAVHVIVLDDVAHLFHPVADDLFIVDGTVLAQQVFTRRPGQGCCL